MSEEAVRIDVKAAVKAAYQYLQSYEYSASLTLIDTVNFNNIRTYSWK